MPAIYPARLKQDSAQLMLLFEQPESFVRSLHSLLNRYANLSHRQGQAGEPASLLDAYNVPKPVMRQIQADIKPLVNDSSTAALSLSDALWNESYYEFRYLAATILGQIKPDPPELIMDRVISWSGQSSEARLRDFLFDRGLERVRQENPGYLIDQIDRWLSDTKPAANKLGLEALIPLVRTANSENLPVFYRIISPVIRELPAGLRTEMRDIVGALALRSPVETAYFLSQMISQGGNPNAAWLARQNLRNFPPEVQNSLRTLLRMPLPEN